MSWLTIFGSSLMSNKTYKSSVPNKLLQIGRKKINLVITSFAITCQPDKKFSSKWWMESNQMKNIITLFSSFVFTLSKCVDRSIHPFIDDNNENKFSAVSCGRHHFPSHVDPTVIINTSHDMYQRSTWIGIGVTIYNRVCKKLSPFFCRKILGKTMKFNFFFLTTLHTFHTQSYFSTHRRKLKIVRLTLKMISIRNTVHKPTQINASWVVFAINLTTVFH